MLIDDVQLLLSNARSFNGDNCEISSCAEKLVSQLINALNHEKTHFGIQGDVINVLEEAIKKKYVLYFCYISLYECIYMICIVIHTQRFDFFCFYLRVIYIIQLSDFSLTEICNATILK